MVGSNGKKKKEKIAREETDMKDSIILHLKKNDWLNHFWLKCIRGF